MFYDDKLIYLLLEYAPGGTLLDKINSDIITEKKASKYVIDICQGLEYIHSKGIIHRDIKPENCLIGIFDQIKLGDFGWAVKTTLNDTDTKIIKYEGTSLAGTIDYLCPEIILELPVDYKVDIWCLSIIIYEMLTGTTPFHNDNQSIMINNILKIKYNLPGFLSESVRNTIQKIIKKNPKDRVDIKDILDFEWIKT